MKLFGRKDKSKVVGDGKGNFAVYGKSGQMAQVLVDGKVWNVGIASGKKKGKK